MQSSAHTSPVKLRHKTLSAYYPVLHTLSDHLTLATGDHSLLLDEDVSAYRELLTKTICAVRGDVGVPAFPLREGIRGTQQEAIDRILRELGRAVRRPGEGRNVLLAGDRVRVLQYGISAQVSVRTNRLSFQSTPIDQALRIGTPVARAPLYDPYPGRYSATGEYEARK